MGRALLLVRPLTNQQFKEGLRIPYSEHAYLNFLGGGNEVCEIPSTSEVQTLHSTPASERRVRLGGIIEVRRERSAYYNLSQVIKMNHSSIAIF